MAVLTGNYRISPAGVNGCDYRSIGRGVAGGAINMFCQPFFCRIQHMTNRTGGGISKIVMRIRCGGRGQAVDDGADRQTGMAGLAWHWSRCAGNDRTGHIRFRAGVAGGALGMQAEAHFRGTGLVAVSA